MKLGNYETNEIDKKAFFDRLDKTYQDDIILGYLNTNGLYGSSANECYYDFVYDTHIGLNTIELSYESQYLSYYMFHHLIKCLILIY